jgi:regulatory protein
MAPRLYSKRTVVTPFVALEKIKKWCAYQERSQYDTRKKLMEYGLQSEEVEAIIADLISENYLNEERFATAYASGKFRIKGWGRNKIRSGLRLHKVSEACIKSALEKIDEKEYITMLEKLIAKKMRLVKGDERKRNYAVMSHLVSKGFESDLISEYLKLSLQDF